MKLPTSISLLLAACLGDNKYPSDVCEDKYIVELYNNFYLDQFEKVACSTRGEADDEFQPMYTVLKCKADGKLYRLNWEKYCSYSYQEPRIDKYHRDNEVVEWKEVEEKERAVKYYVVKEK